MITILYGDEKSVAISDDAEAALLEWAEVRDVTPNEIIIEALERLYLTREWSLDQVDAEVSARVIINELNIAARAFETDLQKTLNSEVGRLRRLRLGERVSQIDGSARRTEAHIEVIATGMQMLLKPWWKRWF